MTHIKTDLEDNSATSSFPWIASDLARILDQEKRHASFLQQVDQAARQECTCRHQGLEHDPTCQGAWVDQAIKHFKIKPVFWAVRSPCDVAMLFRPSGQPTDENDWHMVRNRWFARCRIEFVSSEYPMSWNGRRIVVDQEWPYHIPLPISPPPVLRPTNSPKELIRHLLI